MSGIVCAIRGGPDSQATIARAITLSAETKLPLYFLYIVNLDFLSHTSTARVHTILVITVGLATLWLLFRFLVSGGG